MIQGAVLKVVAGVIITLAIALSVTGWLLKRAWADNATYQANELQYQKTITAQQEAYADLERTRQRREVIVLENLQEKEVITEQKEVIKWQVREVIKHAPPEDCLHQPVPDLILECLRTGDSCASAGDPADISGRGIGQGHTGTGIRREDLWRTGGIYIGLEGRYSGLQYRQGLYSGLAGEI